MISVIVPDTGPLISFARAKRLDLLDRFDCQILIMDAVHFELLDESSNAPEQDDLLLWIESNSNKVQIIETTYGSLLQANRELLQSVPEERRLAIRRKTRVKDAGELAIQEMVNRLRPRLSREATALVLFEDRRVETMSFGPYARVMSTWSFVLALERLGVIASVESIYDTIEASGRFPPKKPFDSFDPALDDFAASYDISRGGRSFSIPAPKPDSDSVPGPGDNNPAPDF